MSVKIRMCFVFNPHYKELNTKHKDITGNFPLTEYPWLCCKSVLFYFMQPYRYAGKLVFATH